MWTDQSVALTVEPRPPRPLWARRLDRWVVRLARMLSPVMGRPSNQVLADLARADRPGPPIRVPSAAELGIIDHLAEGRRALSAGLYADALFHFGARLEDATGADAAWCWHGRGDALQLMGQFADALAAYDQAVALEETVGLHHMGRANALDGLGRSQEAEDATRRALRLDSTLTWMRKAP